MRFEEVDFEFGEFTARFRLEFSGDGVSEDLKREGRGARTGSLRRWSPSCRYVMVILIAESVVPTNGWFGAKDRLDVVQSAGRRVQPSCRGGDWAAKSRASGACQSERQSTASSVSVPTSVPLQVHYAGTALHCFTHSTTSSYFI